jgi:cytochrome c biogenesis protein CcmG/thiol:disulfide interchange protein DsbE
MPSRFDFVRLIAAPASVAIASSVPGCGGSERGAESAATQGDLVGNPAPDFHLKAVTGSKESISMQQMRGQVVLLDFWGTFCQPCKKSFPKLEELNSKYAASGLRVIGVSEDEEDDKDKIPAFAGAYGAKFPLVWDQDKSIARQYKPETMPTTFIIDKKGFVRFAHVGFHDGEEVEIDKEIKGLLSAP